MHPSLIDLGTLPGLAFDVRYASANNFTGAALPGYEAPGAWLHRDAAAALGRVLDSLAPRRLGLIVYDAYRPVRATEAMVAWCEANGREALLDGYIGRTSRHNRGVALDVGLAWREGGAPLPMGTDWDAFHPGSWFANATGPVRANRRALREAMEAGGFTPYDKEWWHFELRLDPLPPPLDVPYSG